MYSMYSKVPCMDGFVNPCRCVCKYGLCSVKIRGSPFFSEDLFQRSLKQYLISLEIIESLLLQCVPTSSGDSRYIDHTYASTTLAYMGLLNTFHSRIIMASICVPFFSLNLFGKIQKEEGKEKETKKYFCFWAKMLGHPVC